MKIQIKFYEEDIVLDVSERTNVMKKQFMALHQDGYYIAEIAKKFELSPATVYRHLQEIADENGVSRHSLLQVVRTPTQRQFREEETRTRANIAELKKGLRDLDEAIQVIIDRLTIIKNEIEEDIQNACD